MVTRGFFVGSIPAMQYATREQVELLQGTPSPQEGPVLAVSSIDPANPYGIWLDWPEAAGVSFARKPGNFLIYSGDRWILWMENYGKSIYTIHSQQPQEAPDAMVRLLRDALRFLLSRCQLRKIVVERWDGMPASESEASERLASAGGEKDRNGYVFWPSSLKGM